MRFLVAVIAVSLAEPAYADDAIAVGAAVGAGGQGGAVYGALELRLDAEWHDVRIGLSARGVWEDGVFRASDWSSSVRAITVIRHVEAHTGPAAIAAGALAPSTLGRIAAGYRASLDDYQRTGARGIVATRTMELALEIDDVIDPALVGGAFAWQFTPPWGVRSAIAIDPTAPGGVQSSVEVGLAHRWEAKSKRAEAAGSVVADVGTGTARDGLSAVGFGSATFEHANARWSAIADVRGGNGTNGAVFGPLYRLERWALLDRARAGVGAGLTLEVAAPIGWASIGARARPGVGALVSATAGLPMGQRVQTGGWVAASRDAIAGAAELRVAWAKRLYSALQIARMYATNSASAAMQPAEWSATVWFGGAVER